MENIKKGAGGEVVGLILHSVVRRSRMEKMAHELPACQRQGLGAEGSSGAKVPNMPISQALWRDYKEPRW